MGFEPEVIVIEGAGSGSTISMQAVQLLLSVTQYVPAPPELPIAVVSVFVVLPTTGILFCVHEYGPVPPTSVITIPGPAPQSLVNPASTEIEQEGPGPPPSSPGSPDVPS